MSTWIGLIRAIGPSTHKKMSMRQLRDGCVQAGFENVRTLLATGNVVFSSNASIGHLGERLTDVLASHGLGNMVFLRRPGDLEDVVARNPFADAAAARPNHLLILFLERSLMQSGTARNWNTVGKLIAAAK